MTQFLLNFNYWFGMVPATDAMIFKSKVLAGNRSK